MKTNVTLGTKRRPPQRRRDSRAMRRYCSNVTGIPSSPRMGRKGFSRGQAKRGPRKPALLSIPPRRGGRNPRTSFAPPGLFAIESRGPGAALRLPPAKSFRPLRGQEETNTSRLSSVATVSKDLFASIPKSGEYLSLPAGAVESLVSAPVGGACHC